MKIEQCCSPSRPGRYCKKWNTARSTLHRVCLHSFEPKNVKLWTDVLMFCILVPGGLAATDRDKGKPRSKLLSLFIFDIYSCWLSHMTLAASAPHWVIFQKSREICFVPSPWFSFELATGSVNWFKLLNYSLRQQARPTGIIASVCPKTSFKKIKSTGLSKF